MHGILREMFGPAVQQPEYFETQIFGKPIRVGGVYSCAYVCKQEFEAANPPPSTRRFVLIRDLRDTLVSAYFSLRNTHPLETPSVERARIVLQRFNKEDGLLYLMETWLCKSAVIQRSWVESGERCFRLEDSMQNAVEELNCIFREAWQLKIERDELASLVTRHSFENLSGGRKSGIEDLASHYRKGIAGDWRLHFTPKITSRFKYLYGDLLQKSGYETDDSWEATNV
jgi:lipopolysaccharide transport system ATP-binding protein